MFFAKSLRSYNPDYRKLWVAINIWFCRTCTVTVLNQDLDTLTSPFPCTDFQAPDYCVMSELSSKLKDYIIYSIFIIIIQYFPTIA